MEYICDIDHAIKVATSLAYLQSTLTRQQQRLARSGLEAASFPSLSYWTSVAASCQSALDVK